MSHPRLNQNLEAPHPGPVARATRMAAAMTLSATAYKMRVSIAKLCRYEKGIGDLTAAEQARLEGVLREGVRARSKALEVALRQGSTPAGGEI